MPVQSMQLDSDMQRLLTKRVKYMQAFGNDRYDEMSVGMIARRIGFTEPTLRKMLNEKHPTVSVETYEKTKKWLTK